MSHSKSDHCQDMRSRSIPVFLAAILILCVTELARGLSFSFLFGGRFIGQQIVVHTPPERGFIDRDASEILYEESPLTETDLITNYTQSLGT